MTRLPLLALSVVACSAGGAPPARPQPAAPAGALVVTTTYEAGGVRTRAHGRGVELANLPLAELLGLPMTGAADVDADVTVPLVGGRRDYRGATGTIALACPSSCTLGDGHTRLVPRSSNPRIAAFAGNGIDFGHVTFDRFDAKIELANNSATVTAWHAESKDLKLLLSLRVELAAELDASKLDGCVRFAATDALRAREPKTSAAISTTGAPVAADGHANIRLEGQLGAVRMLGQVCDGSVAVPPSPTPLVDTPERPDSPDVDDPDLTTLMNRSITKRSATAYDVRKQLLDAVLANPMSIAKSARLVPALKDGKPIGFKLYAIRPDSIYAKLGLTNGDTIQRVNGLELVSADSALEIYTKLRDAPFVEIELDRRQTKLSLRWTIVP